MRRFNNHKFTYWIAAWAILLGALAPAVSQGLSVSQSGKGFAVEICSANGGIMTQVIGDNESSAPSTMGDHCPYCVIQPIYLLPAVYVYEFVAPQSYGAISAQGYLAPTFSSSWLTQPSRAPPSQS